MRGKEKLIKSTKNPHTMMKTSLKGDECGGEEEKFSSHRNPQFVTHLNVKVFLKQAATEKKCEILSK